jgi:hypothetical protein
MLENIPKKLNVLAILATNYVSFSCTTPWNKKILENSENQRLTKLDKNLGFTWMKLGPHPFD